MKHFWHIFGSKCIGRSSFLGGIRRCLNPQVIQFLQPSPLNTILWIWMVSWKSNFKFIGFRRFIGEKHLLRHASNVNLRERTKHSVISFRIATIFNLFMKLCSFARKFGSNRVMARECAFLNEWNALRLFVTVVFGLHLKLLDAYETLLGSVSLLWKGSCFKVRGYLFYFILLRRLQLYFIQRWKLLKPFEPQGFLDKTSGHKFFRSNSTVATELCVGNLQPFFQRWNLPKLPNPKSIFFGGNDLGVNIIPLLFHCICN